MRHLIFFVVYLGLATCLNPSATLKAQYKIEGWPIKKSWGPVRGTYIDPQKRELRMVFEDTAGTVRIVTIDPEAKTAVPVCELPRQ